MNKITYLCIVAFFAMLNVCEAQIQRVRIDFVSPDKYTRHLLLAFTPDNAASDGFDYGYDGPNPDNFLNDLNWMIDDNRYVIQGVGAFEDTKQYPFGLFLADSGEIEIVLTDLENFDSEIDVFIYDSVLDSYTKINDEKFKMNIDAADYLNRFFIAFKSAEEEVEEDPIEEEEIETLPIEEIEISTVKYLNTTNEIYVQTPNNIDIKEVYLINMLGQVENSWNLINNNSLNELKIPVYNVSNGVYIIRVETNKKPFIKKILVN